MTNLLLFLTVTALFATVLGFTPGNHYVFAQEGFQTEDLVNETIDLGNNTATSNATLAFAQEGAITPEGSVNDTMSGQNASQWASNATLAFAQEGFQTEDLVNETIDLGNNTATSNATLAFAQEHTPIHDG